MNIKHFSFGWVCENIRTKLPLLAALPPAQPPATQITESSLAPFRQSLIFDNTLDSYKHIKSV